MVHDSAGITDGPDPDRDPSAGHWSVVRRLAPYLWPAGRPWLRIRIVLAGLLLIAAKIVTVYTPFFYKNAVDTLDVAGSAVAVVPVALIVSYGLARFAARLFGELRDALFVRVSQHALRSLALETFRHLHTLGLRFHLDRRTGGLSRAIERGTRGIDFLLRFMLFSILPTILELALVTGIFYVNFGLDFSLALLASIVLFVAFTFVVTEWRTKFRRDMNQQDSAANTKAIDSLLNYETVKYFGNEDHEARRYDTALARYQSAAVKSQLSLSLLNGGQQFVVNLCLVVLMVMAASGYAAGDMTLGDFVLVNTLLIQLFIPLNVLGFVYREIKQSLIDMEYMFGLLDRDREVADKPDAVPLTCGGGAIEFRHVTFGYDERRTILHDVSFSVPAGGTVAVVGPSGAGKSTISRILFRFYDIAGGAVLIDGQDIRDVIQASLRARIGMVPQDTVLFNDTIRYNIQYGRPDAGEQEVIEAARLARIDGFVANLPDGYDSVVGERGLKLSGGEKQRVAIARTILKNPPILLLDEATSALDTRTEQEIQEALETMARNRTTLIIAHRLSTVVSADEILVLEDGRIAERGDHASLLERQGIYAAMWARQQEAAAVQARLTDLRQDRLVAPAGQTVL